MCTACHRHSQASERKLAKSYQWSSRMKANGREVTVWHSQRRNGHKLMLTGLVEGTTSLPCSNHIPDAPKNKFSTTKRHPRHPLPQAFNSQTRSSEDQNCLCGTRSRGSLGRRRYPGQRDSRPQTDLQASQGTPQGCLGNHLHTSQTQLGCCTIQGLGLLIT